MKLNQNFKNNNYYIILLFIFPLSIIIGQAAISINYFLIIIITFIVLFNRRLFLNYKANLYLLSPFFLILIISSVYNYYFLEYNSPIKSLLYLKNLFLVLFTVHILNNQKQINLFLKIIFFLCLFVAIDNYIQYFLGYDVFGYQKSKFRLTGPFGDNEYVTGAYLSKFLILTLPLYFLNKKENISFISVFYLVFFFCSILITGERASLFYFTIGFSIFILIYIKKIKKLFLIFSSLTLILFLAVNYNKTINYKFLQTSYQIGTLKFYSNMYDMPEEFKDFEDKNFFDSKHGAHFLTAYEIWKNFKIIGVGPKNFSLECQKDKYNKIESDNFNHRCNTHPHNIYLELLSETGITGLILFLIILIIIFNKIYKLLLIKRDPYLISSFSQVVSIIWPLTTSGSIISNFNGSFFWLNLGILIAIMNITKNEKK